MSLLLHFIDLFGTFVFALSGATVGVRNRFDLFGVFALSFVTAIGGGCIRDLCLGATPPAGLVNIEYFGCVILAITLLSYFQKLVFSFEKPAMFFDALGLGFFAAFGANKAWLYTGNVEFSILMGCISAVGGGCLRDVLVGKTPVIFTKEIYASAALIGAGIELLGSAGIIPEQYSIWISIVVCTLIRLLSLKYNITLKTIANKYF
ncbi:trimeric intracellular cation channel family protein [Tatumella citrea]|uniref:Glycine transporter domain-containing protein n=1 Tax=Tatumella citrea TaxID=53336 RepID=A0A1Y0LIL9_TATCI|nr:trimeric intracellular cation channel family protein [Tatumella citrea]ARU93894.1 hypothetical protein A7K98_08975 [Tatumella citrea]ARU97932.1 hypothetical protein A7K99_08975 [Tatumella citrea]